MHRCRPAVTGASSWSTLEPDDGGSSCCWPPVSAGGPSTPSGQLRRRRLNDCIRRQRTHPSNPEETFAALMSLPRSCRSDPNTGTRWRPRSGGHTLAGGTQGDCDAVPGLRPCGLTASGSSRASHGAADAAGAGWCPWSTTTAIGQGGSRCTAWFSSTPRPSSLKPKTLPAPTCRSPSSTSSTPSSNAASWRRASCACAAATAATTGWSRSAATGAASVPRAGYGACPRRRRTGWAWRRPIIWRGAWLAGNAIGLQAAQGSSEDASQHSGPRGGRAAAPLRRSLLSAPQRQLPLPRPGAQLRVGTAGCGGVRAAASRAPSDPAATCRAQQQQAAEDQR